MAAVAIALGGLAIFAATRLGTASPPSDASCREARHIKACVAAEAQRVDDLSASGALLFLCGVAGIAFGAVTALRWRSLSVDEVAARTMIPKSVIHRAVEIG